MPLPQQKFREIVFQLLYSKVIGNPHPDAMTEMTMAQLSVSKKNIKEAQEYVKLLLEKLQEIDSLISSVSTNYDFSRIQTVTKNILRLGVYELVFNDTIPPKVAISEAMRLARKFGTPESASFVNALLDHIFKSRNGLQSDAGLVKNQALALEQSEEEIKKYAEEALRNEETKKMSDEQEEE